MTRRLKTVSKIARIIDHQKEVIEFQVMELTHRQTLEKERLTILEKDLYDNIDRFEESLNDRIILNSEEVAFLFAMASTLMHKIEREKKEIDQIEKELTALRAIFWEAYKKKKAIEIVQNKILVQERKKESVLEQKNIDYLNLSSRPRP
jgi:hypothetical protein